MIHMSEDTKYKDLKEFLSKHGSKKNDGSDEKLEITHTRIADKDLNIFGGAYHIPNDELEVFRKLYYNHVFVNKNKEYLTEKQLDVNGPILVDFDFRYGVDITERVHTQEHIQDMIYLYLDVLKELLVFRENESFPIFIMEKPNINRDSEKDLVKDGIHMIIGIQMDRTLQVMLRERIVAKIPEIWDLPLINDWNSVLDEGISKGCVNWQLYGSQKPGHQSYRLTYHINACIDLNDNEFRTKPCSIKDFDYESFKLLSAQYDKHTKFDINPKVFEEYENLKNSKKSKPKTATRPKIQLVLDNDDNDDNDEIDINNITDIGKLTRAMDKILNNLKTNEYHVREIHQYTQILPEKYYRPGSHLLNRQVAFALKHTDNRLFLSWIMLRSKAADFDYSTIPKLYNDWNKYFNVRPDGITKRSIIFWAMQDAYEDYQRVKKSTVDYFIEETLLRTTECDFANVLYYMFGEKYVCSSIVHKHWYVFRNHRWEFDEGQTLRAAISKDVFTVYQDKLTQYVVELQNHTSNDEFHEKMQRKIKTLAEVSTKLKRTNDKNNIMREAMELFYDKDFSKNRDSNKYLLCFNNGVVDFKNKVFRQGLPQDYITKSTKIDYVPFESIPKNINNGELYIEQVKTFMEQLFPLKDLCRYMWDHLASCLIGAKKEHVFNIYRGSGSNGKSILTDLMTQTLGEYKGTVPISLVTEKRSNLGGTTSEVVQLKGVRYAVMQEPSKDAVINEGILKELTGGDPIQARALYCDSEIFEPQFSLVVCTNVLFEVKSMDDGTWRRMMLVDFLSKFYSEGEICTDDTKYVFPKDKGLKERLPLWAPIFASMLVKRAFETEGEVKVCEEVIQASKKYRQNQDFINGFISEKIIVQPGKSVGKRELNETFKDWFLMTYGNKRMPKLTELEEAIIKKYGQKNRNNKWLNIAIKYDENEKDDMDEFE